MSESINLTVGKSPMAKFGETPMTHASTHYQDEAEYEGGVPDLSVGESPVKSSSPVKPYQPRNVRLQQAQSKRVNIVEGQMNISPELRVQTSVGSKT